MHRLPALLLSALALVCAGALPAQAADSWDVPHDARLTIDGHGFGHGRGMSQHGAQAAASAGRDHRQILGYYYPGTSWGSAGGSVRVWLAGDTTDDVQVAARSGLTAHKVGGASWNLAKAEPRANRWRIRPAGSRASVLQYRTAAWHDYRRVGGVLELGAHGKPVRLYEHGGSTAYRGALRSVPFRDERLTVNVLPLEAYLRGVVPAEMPASRWKQEALRAQAVASRTYVVHQRLPGNTYYDVDDTARDQAYGGASAEHSASDRAVSATARRVLTYAGSPAFTEFTASSGGWTVAGDEPYLPARQDRWDTPEDPNHSWRVGFTDRELEHTWRGIGDLSRIEIGGRDGNGEWDGRAGTVTLTGDRGTKTLTGDAFYQALHLRSAWLTITVR